jgi:glutaryl-CoA dehydrogenase (non-decarboxylating)
MAQQGYLGAVLPKEVGGAGMDMITFGLLNEEIARGCSSLRSLLTVHSMVARTLLKWGSKEQKRWLAPLASGAAFAAFALTEPEVGSDAQNIATRATPLADSFVLDGQKKWITGGQIADVFLIFAQCEAKPAAFLVERGHPGLHIEPIQGMLGTRASMLAELHLNECRIPKENLVGRIGFGISPLAASALDYGRYSVAWGCVGIAQACQEACLKYTSERKQFGVYLKEHQLIQRLITGMIVNVKAARLLCYQAGFLKDKGDPQSVMETFIAKYFSARMVTRVAADAVQIHGANGCSGDYAVQRFLRDATIMEIIEGATQVQEIAIARNAYQELGF